MATYARGHAGAVTTRDIVEGAARWRSRAVAGGATVLATDVLLDDAGNTIYEYVQRAPRVALLELVQSTRELRLVHSDTLILKTRPTELRVAPSAIARAPCGHG